MQEAGIISNYLDALADALSFDRSLSRCVRQEVEDHLREAVAADPRDDALEAERHAIANFGDPRIIAAEFAVLSLAKQTRRVGVAVMLVTAGVFATMMGRLAWYAAAQWPLSDDMRAAGGIVGSIDRCAFWLSIVIGIAALAQIGGRHMSPVLEAGYRRRLRRSFVLCFAATVALAVSVISDGVLTALRLHGAELSAGPLVPLSSMAIEIAGIGILLFQIRRMTRRATSTAALLTA